MEQSDLLRFLATTLEALGLAYFVTGSIATTYYSEPRFTNDIDVVVDLPAARVHDFCSAFSTQRFYVSEEAALAAARTRTQFNIIEPETGLKIDVMVPEDSAFNRSRFSRARSADVGQGVRVRIAAPEDAIIKKMQYYREGGSEKHLRDIASVLRVSGDSVDREYIARWAEDLGLNEIWSVVLERLTKAT